MSEKRRVRVAAGGALTGRLSASLSSRQGAWRRLPSALASAAFGRDVLHPDPAGPAARPPEPRLRLRQLESDDLRDAADPLRDRRAERRRGPALALQPVDRAVAGKRVHTAAIVLAERRQRGDVEPDAPIALAVGRTELDGEERPVAVVAVDVAACQRRNRGGIADDVAAC